MSIRNRLSKSKRAVSPTTEDSFRARYALQSQPTQAPQATSIVNWFKHLWDDVKTFHSTPRDARVHAGIADLDRHVEAAILANEPKQANAAAVESSKAWAVQHTEVSELKALCNSGRSQFDATLTTFVVQQASRLEESAQADVLGALATKVLHPEHARIHPDAAEAMLNGLHRLPSHHRAHVQAAGPLVALDNAIQARANGWSASTMNSWHRTVAAEASTMLKAYAGTAHGGLLRQVAASTNAEVKASFMASVERYSHVDFARAQTIMAEGKKADMKRTSSFEFEVGGKVKHGPAEVSGRTKYSTTWDNDR